ncbi:hypothetical protein ATKI12_7223 [Kitasatospora sp. Ki12]
MRIDDGRVSHRYSASRLQRLDVKISRHGPLAPPPPVPGRAPVLAGVLRRPSRGTESTVVRAGTRGNRSAPGHRCGPPG